MADDRFERLANLVTYLLDAERGATFADILRVIPGYPEGEDARRRAFERDKKLLRDEDIPLVERDGVYRIPPAEYYLPDLGLTDDEQLALQLAVAAVPVGGGQAGQALQKLTIGGAVGDGADGAQAALADLDEHPLLPALHAAIRRRATVTFTHGPTGDRQRTVEPSLLFFRDGHWYLHGFDRLRQADRNFRVDRITGEVAEGAPGGFARRAAPADAAAAMPRQPWLIGADPPEDAHVRVDAVLAAKAVADVGPAGVVERHDDGSVTITVAVVQRDAFRSWLLGLLDHAEVVGPPALRAEMAAWLRSLAVGPAR